MVVSGTSVAEERHAIDLAPNKLAFYAAAMGKGGAAAAICIALLASSLASAATAPGKWRAAVKVPGIVDVVGPRADGRLVLSSTSGLYVMRPAGSPVPYARQGYAGSRGEPYLALGGGRRVPGAGCAFQRDVIFVLDPDATPGILRVDRSGRSNRFVDLPAGAFPSGITIDAVGSFGYRLLVTTFAAGATTVYAFDCRARRRVVATGAPHVEGGIAVAPRTFGRFGGTLVAVDEVAGRIYSFGPRGRVRLLAQPGLAAGADIGVEALGFVPAKLGRGAAYLADLGAPSSPTTGSDALLVLAGAALSRANLRPGELIVATEAGAKTIAVHCARRCGIRRVAEGPVAAHAEGHITFIPRR
jgi:hypothetical protein